VLEEAEGGKNGKKRKSKATARYTQMMLFDPGNGGGNPAEANRPGPVETVLRKMNVEEMTPIEALNKLHELKRLLD
jgi:DNA mismatch repair protein MutS